MESVGQQYRQWVMRQRVSGIEPQRVDDDHLCIQTSFVRAHVTFRALEDDRELVELRMGRSDDLSPTFFVRFVLGDLRHARDLFREMAAAIKAETARGVARVLVCGEDLECVRHFASVVQEAAQTLPVAIEFAACSVDEAFASAPDHVAIMLAPEAAMLRSRLMKAHPYAAVFPIPDAVFARSDGQKALCLLSEALHEVHSSGPCCELSFAPERCMCKEGRVLVINVAFGDRCVRVGYRVYDQSTPIAHGVVIKGHLAMADIDDLLQTLCVLGVPLHTLDAIGIAVPAVVNCYSMSFPGLGMRDPDLCEALQRRYGIPTFVDNSTNAAAMGCLVLQDEGDSLTIYRHQLGHKNGGQGTVIAGKLVTGQYGLAGEPKLYQRGFRYPHGYVEAVWSAEGLTQIAQNVLLASIGTVSPAVAYLAVSALDDTDAIRSVLERTLPVYCVPQIVLVEDYRERMYLGEVALCLERLEGGA